MRFNPKARLDRGRVKDTGQGSGNSGMGGAGMRLPIPGGVGTGGIGGVICRRPDLRAGAVHGRQRRQRRSAATRPRASRTTPRAPAATTTARPGRTPRRAGLCPSGGRELAHRLLGRRARLRLPAGGEPDHLHRLRADRLRRRDLRRGAVLLPGRQHHLPRHRLLRRGAGAPARRARGRVRRVLRAGPRVRPPHPEPLGHHEQGEDAAEARRATRSGSSCRPTATPACGRRPPPAPRTPRARC